MLCQIGTGAARRRHSNTKLVRFRVFYSIPPIINEHYTLSEYSSAIIEVVYPFVSILIFIIFSSTIITNSATHP